MIFVTRKPDTKKLASRIAPQHIEIVSSFVAGHIKPQSGQAHPPVVRYLWGWWHVVVSLSIIFISTSISNHH